MHCPAHAQCPYACPYRRMRHYQGPPPQTPSIAAHIIGAIFLFFSAILLLYNARRIGSMSLYMSLVVVLLFSIAIMVHGISHLFLEKEYGYYWPLVREPAAGGGEN
jgi:hypothetical protein